MDVSSSSSPGAAAAFVATECCQAAVAAGPWPFQARKPITLNQENICCIQNTVGLCIARPVLLGFSTRVWHN